VAGVGSIARIKGALVLSPTSLTGASPFGGTLLEPTRDIVVFCGADAQAITAEEWGGQAVEILQGPDEARISVVLRAWDASALAAALPHSEAGASGDRLWSYQPAADDEDTVRPGRALGESYGVTIAVMPRAIDRQPCVVLHNAVPAIEQTHRLRLSLNAELDLGMVWHGLPDDSGRVVSIGRRGDITL